ncbi:NAD-dependent epimerase/dehydratase family protein [Muricauda sp. ANG21]|uniref:NAD-dependent epimerase/dehydratase family protein n=1 Tax=Allomuricauda sp. ANG21 TaxID=3042468 RepID=UPI003452C1EB
MKILVTGCAGFIGFHLARQLLKNNHDVTGLDNINDYYDIDLKLKRLKELGIDEKSARLEGQLCSSTLHPNFRFIKTSLDTKKAVLKVFEEGNFEIVCNLAAQAGVRYSLENPDSYVESNLVGFVNILECCRQFKIRHLIYASSSSVYGLNKAVPFKTSHSVDKPISLYAATKKSNELMAYTYSHLFGFRATGLRFFTVYGPWGRPDMAMFMFTKAIIEGKTISVFNNGNLERDFTYIDDIIRGMLPIVEERYTSNYNKEKLYHLYNIGNSKPVKLMAFIGAIETQLGKKAEIEMMPMQPGDVTKTWADVSGLEQDYNYSPNTPIEKGVHKFIDWYKSFYGV